jgi:hypothetical protein
VLITPSYWGSQLADHNHHQHRAASSSFLAPLPGKKKKTSARGVFFHTHILYFVLLFCFTLFLLALFYIKNTKKLESLIFAFIYLLLVYHVVP